MRAGLAVLAATLVAFAPPAQAHDSLISSTPADGDQLDSPPDEVVLSFSAEPIDVGGDIRVLGPDGTDVAVSEPEYSGREVSVEVDPDVPDGDFEIRWRIVSSDGHPIQGVIEFAVGATSPDDDATSAPSAGSPTEPAGDADQPTDADQADDTDQPDEAGSSVPWRSIAVAGGGALLAGLIYAAVLYLRRERRDSAPAEPTRERDGSDT